MIPFTQDNVNKLTNYILNNTDLRPFVMTEDWGSLFTFLYNKYERSGGHSLGFLYQYFMQMDNFNVLTLLRRIPEYSFLESDLTSIEIPGNVTSIGSYAFYGCEKLESVVIPSSIKEIGKGVFKDCYALTDINYRGTKKQWSAIQKSPSWNWNWNNVHNVRTIHCTDGDIKI